jgi:nucleotide-binding universal stress UspA family protein/hemerythrin-like domain-containing protein
MNSKQRRLVLGSPPTDYSVTMYKHLLVPIDGTPLASLIVEHAVDYARSTNARLTFLHARPDASAHGDGALLHAMSPQDFADAAAGNARALLARSEASARAADVLSESILVISDKPHTAILQAAVDVGCDLVFMASHGRKGLKGAIQGALLGSVSRRVLEQAMVPVLIVAVESNLVESTDEQRALSLLRREHRSLAAVLHALQDLSVDTSKDADKELQRAMLFYIEHFPERLHHPKEEAYLFRLVRERSQECDMVLAELEEQHSVGASQFALLRSALEAGERSAFAGRLQVFADLQWRHMAVEEKLLFPAASRLLLADDWHEIALAFEVNGDPRFGVGESFESLASRLLELASRRS